MRMRGAGARTERSQGWHVALFLSEIGVPTVAVNVLTLTRLDTGLAVCGVHFCCWAPVACAIWALFVMHCGPFTISKRRTKTIGRDREYVIERFPCIEESGD